MKILSALAFATALSAAVLAEPISDEASWMQWRGPDGTGVAPNANPPTSWSADQNIRWKTAVPGEGHSSPIVLGDRIYLTAAIRTERTGEAANADSGDEGENAAEQSPRDRREERGRRGRGRGAPTPSNVYEFVVMAIDRADGRIVWRTMVREEVPHEGTHRTGSFAAGSPVTDGTHLYAFFGSRGLFCLDLDGTVKWQRDFGDMRVAMSFGEGASPALHGGTLVVPWDHEGDSAVYALDKTTGAQKWRSEREEGTTWTTPVMVEVDGTTQAIVAGTTATIAYELETGRELWRCSGLTRNVIPTPVVGHGMIYLTSGFRGSALQAIRLSAARGDISSSEAIVWTHDRGTPYVPSPLLYGERLYVLRSNNGIVSCFDALTGEEHYTGERLENLGNVYASPVGAGGKVYVCGREGDVAVLEDGPTLKVLATNSLGEGIDATPAIVGDAIYLRTSGHLYCIAEAE